MMPTRAYSLSLIGLALAIHNAACGSEVIATGENGGDLIGDEPSDGTPGEDPPTSGQSDCSMFDPSTCEDGEACTPTAQVTRACAPNALLDVGESCDPSSDILCVGGALCFGAHHNGAVCVEVCDTNAPKCPAGQRCNRWVEIDGESLGYCSSDD